MVFVDAILAFAITLLALSLVGTFLVDLVVRRLRLRSDGLRTVLVKLYLDFLSFNKISLGPAAAAAEADTFAQTIIDFAGVKERPAAPVAAAPPPAGGPAPAAPAPPQQVLDDQAQHASDYQNFSPLEWLKPETLDKALSPSSSAAPDSDLFSNKHLTLFNDGIRLDFVQYVKDHFPMRAQNQGRVFAAQSRRISYCFAFTVAVALNVNSYDVLQTFLSNAAVREKVITTSQSKPFQEQSEEILTDNAQPGQLRRSLTQLEDWNLPLGWQGSSFAKSISDVKSGAKTWKRFGWELMFWLLSICASGLLIGQGAPFWYDSIKRITSLKDGSAAK
jgi:hypothetical protein